MSENEENKYIFNSKRWTKVIHVLMFILSFLCSALNVILFLGFWSIEQFCNVFLIILFFIMLCYEILIFSSNYLFLDKYFYNNNKNKCTLIASIATFFPVVLALLLILVLTIIDLFV